MLSFLLLFSAVVFAMTGCEWSSVVGGTDKAQSTSALTSAPKKTQKTTAATTTTAAPTVFDPLTGLPSEDKSFSRPISVCIGNTPNAFPQYGPENADVLVEAQVEGGITRLMAIISDYSSLTRVGSVRSTREYLLNLSEDFGAVALYAGTSDITSGTAVSGKDTLDYIHQNLSSVYYRDTNLSAPHNLMTDGDRIAAGISAAGYSTTLPSDFKSPLNFAPWGQTASLGSAAGGVSIVFSSTQTSDFRYNPESGLYERGGAATVARGGIAESQAFSNIVVLFCNATIRETAGNASELELDTTSGGSGLCLTNGTYAKIRWTRSAKDGSLQFTDASGGQLYLNRGKTYIGLMRVSLEDNVKISK